MTADVMDGVMTSFDKDSSGTVEYSEFLSGLFPTLGRGIVNRQ